MSPPLQCILLEFAALPDKERKWIIFGELQMFYAGSENSVLFSNNNFLSDQVQDFFPK